ncbi:hypothetical protein SXCC_02309 [Gluconacetobacter sp. SXCC-1]|nr:hypothetical protein SXCC_02309 [Gluconacetobacter sp. SXCC-1]
MRMNIYRSIRSVFPYYIAVYQQYPGSITVTRPSRPAPPRPARAGADQGMGGQAA